MFFGVKISNGKHPTQPASISPTSPMALTQVREPPHVSQPHAEAHTGEHVLGLVFPFGAVSSLLMLQFLQLFIGQDPVFQAWVRQQ